MNKDALRIVSALCSRYSGERYLGDELVRQAPRFEMNYLYKVFFFFDGKVKGVFARGVLYMSVEGEVRGLVHVRGESPGSNNNCLYQTMFYVSTRKGVLFLRVSPLQKMDKVKVSYIAFLLVKTGSA
jgi:hypothetical protein